MSEDDEEARAGIGVGPHPEPWPDDPRYDRELLQHGDRRNVIDAYRYMSVEAIRADLDTRRHAFHVAVEHWTRDPNIGSVVRSANAFNASAVHVIGKRRWNRRGAMKTDAYMHVHHHDTLVAFVAWAQAAALPIVGLDTGTGAVSIHEAELPAACVLLLGQEGAGLSVQARAAASAILSIPQYGSTRSINAGVASGIAMHAWIRQHAGPPPA
jgi:tRNA G18 (ribose-2'-O)-methylase SpoU